MVSGHFRTVWHLLEEEAYDTAIIFATSDPLRFGCMFPEVRIEHPTPESLWEGNSGLVPADEPDENTFKRAASAREDQVLLTIF